jgi:hypothetical protein
MRAPPDIREAQAHEVDHGPRGMTGDEPLAPLLRHHRRGYHWAARLCLAAEDGEDKRRAAAEGFLVYFYGEALAHMRRRNRRCSRSSAGTRQGTSSGR